MLAAVAEYVTKAGAGCWARAQYKHVLSYELSFPCSVEGHLSPPTLGLTALREGSPQGHDIRQRRKPSHHAHSQCRTLSYGYSDKGMDKAEISGNTDFSGLLFE